jgi:hypothetical protein
MSTGCDDSDDDGGQRGGRPSPASPAEKSLSSSQALIDVATRVRAAGIKIRKIAV